MCNDTTSVRGTTPTPTYSNNYITPAYGISSSVLGGFNLSLNTLNGFQISKGTNNKTIAIVGLITGASQTILGASMFPKTTNDFYGNTKEIRKTLSMINIGLGDNNYDFKYLEFNHAQKA